MVVPAPLQTRVEKMANKSSYKKTQNTDLVLRIMAFDHTPFTKDNQLCDAIILEKLHG
jgi:hypothetical protein